MISFTQTCGNCEYRDTHSTLMAFNTSFYNCDMLNKDVHIRMGRNCKYWKRKEEEKDVE